jgi:hypothetical protein
MRGPLQEVSGDWALALNSTRIALRAKKSGVRCVVKERDRLAAVLHPELLHNR